MNIGPLDRRVRIQTASSVQSSDSGRPKTSWVTHATVWANVQDVMPSRDETLVASKEVSAQRVRVRIRWRDDVTQDMRFNLTDPTDRTLRIVGGPAEVGGRRMFMEFMCEQIKP